MNRNFMLVSLKAILFGLIMMCSVGLMAQTLTTDKPDYAPGTTANFKGAGFAAGETISLVVHHADGTPDTGADHDPWTVTADANGDFITTWHVCNDDCLGSTLRVTANGLSSGLFAEALFTDGNPPVPYVMSSGNYSEQFGDIANWTDNFAAGIGAGPWGSVAINATGTIPDGVRTTNATSTFVTGASGGVQKGTLNIQLLSTGTASSCAIDLYLDFTGRQAGTLTFDAATVFNSTGDRDSKLKIYYSIDGTTWTELTGTNLPFNARNNVAGSATITASLPSVFTNSATARLRFYEYSTATGTTPTGSQPKISIDNVAVTSTVSSTPSNDLCVNATNVVIGAAAISGTLAGATFSTPFTASNDVWYKFTPTCTGTHSIVVAGFVHTTSDIDIQLFQGCPSSTTPLASSGGSTNSETISTSLTAGVTYNLRVLLFAGTGGSFNVSVTAPTPATPVVSTSAASSIGTTTATLNGSVTTLGVCPSTTEKGFVYSQTSVNANPLNAGTGVTKTSVTGLTTGTYTLAVSGLTSSTGYTFKAYVFDGTTYTYGAALTFTTAAAPVNDLCANATTITVNAASISGTMVGASNTANTFAYSSTSNDVWYKFVPAVTGSHTVTLTFTAATSRDIDVDIFTSASCPTTGTANFTAHGTTATEAITNTFTAGTTYYIRAIDFGSVNGGVFSIGITGPVSTITTSGTLTAVNTTYGTASATPTSFNVSGANMAAAILVTAPAGYEVSCLRVRDMLIQ